jgi:hypothetical protein
MTRFTKLRMSLSKALPTIYTPLTGIYSAFDVELRDLTLPSSYYTIMLALNENSNPPLQRLLNKSEFIIHIWSAIVLRVFFILVSKHGAPKIRLQALTVPRFTRIPPWLSGVQSCHELPRVGAFCSNLSSLAWKMVANIKVY